MFGGVGFVYCDEFDFFDWMVSEGCGGCDVCMYLFEKLMGEELVGWLIYVVLL